MKMFIAVVFVFLIGGYLGANFPMFESDSVDESRSTESGADEKKPLYWVAPMDKNYRRDAPGLSPMGMELVPVYAKNNEKGDAIEGLVSISPVVINNLGVKTSKVERSTLFQTIETIGTVKFDESKIQHIHSRVEGWIEVLNVSASGDPIKKGQTLYELYSPALVNVQEEYLAALRSGNKNLIKASKSRLMSLGLDEAQAKRIRERGKVDQRVKVLADADGVVIDLMARPGMFIKPATEVLSIGSLDTVWILAEVFERQSYLVETGQAATVKFNAMPGKQWQSEVDYIYPELNASSRTLLLRLSIQNKDHLLKPNMFANINIQSRNAEKSLNIPRQALIKGSNHQRVVKALGEGRFKSVFVKAGFEGLDQTSLEPMVQILEGLEESDRVVISAQFLIDSESNIDAELLRMESEADVKHQIDDSTVMATGIINSVMAGHSMLNINHEPVLEWGWPDMTMNFDVEPSLDLSQLNRGEKISFAIKKYEDGSIAITDILTSRSQKVMKSGASQ